MTAGEPAGLGDRPRPVPDLDTAFFWDGCGEGRLPIQRCADCGRLRHPPLPSCPSCRSLRWDVADAAGRGVVHTFTVHHHPPVPGFDVPFVIAVVELDEGPRIVTNLVDVDPAAVAIGDEVELTFVTLPGGVRLPQFRPWTPPEGES